MVKGTIISQRHYVEDEEVTASSSVAYDGKVESVAMPEGRILTNGKSYQYEYELTDHLGNNRVNFQPNADGTLTVGQIQNYYPFGANMGDATMNYSASPTNSYLYNSQELQPELNLNTYDFGARHYEPALARWMSIDPLADDYEDVSPYNYVDNNPMNLIDPDGMGPGPVIGTATNPTQLGEVTIISAPGGGTGNIPGVSTNGGLLSNPFGEAASSAQLISAAYAAGQAFKWSVKPTINLNHSLTEVQGNNMHVSNPRGTPWLNYAHSQLGVKEATGNNDGPDVDKYLATAGLKGTGLPWCGCFANWSMKSARIKGPKDPAVALNWRKFGVSLSRPAFGSIGTRERLGGGHVGFVVAWDAQRSGWVIMLGGNQGDAVSYESFPVSILKFNYPAGFIPSYSLPTMSGIPRGVRMK